MGREEAGRVVGQHATSVGERVICCNGLLSSTNHPDLGSFVAIKTIARQDSSLEMQNQSAISIHRLFPQRGQLEIMHFYFCSLSIGIIGICK